MKKLFAILLALCMLTSVFVGCTENIPSGIESDTDAESDTTPESETDAMTNESTTPDGEITTDEGETTPESDPASESDTVAETTPETEPAYETNADGYRIAGTDSGIVRDGTPKKYFTIRMDDGITQDAKIIEILKKYDVDCITFYANSGLFGANWAWVGESAGRPDVTHIRYTRKEFASIYEGYDVGCHTQNHPSLKDCDDAKITSEVELDRKNLARLLDYTPVGMAWPGGDTEWNEHTVDTVMATTNIRFGSCTTSTNSFALPEYFMTWYPTCAFNAVNTFTLLQQFLDAEPTEDMLFYVWGHGYELDIGNSWDRFEEMIQMIAEAAAEDDSIVLVTNSEFYQLFKDEIPSWKGSVSETDPVGPVDVSEAESWDVKKDVVVHVNFDELRPDGSTNWDEGIFHPTNEGSAQWDRVADLSGSDALYLQFFGWIGTKGTEIGTFGYRIDSADPVWDPLFASTAGSDVLAAAPSFGAANATRMAVDIELRGLTGRHRVTVYYMDPAGKVVVLDKFTVIMPAAKE